MTNDAPLTDGPASHDRRTDGEVDRAVVIPTDLDRWHPNEITTWLNDYEYDEKVSESDLARARQAAAHALGVDL